MVACFLGNLYSKAAVLEWLLARAGRVQDDAAMHRYLNQLRTGGAAFDHLQSLKWVAAVWAEGPAWAAACLLPAVRAALLAVGVTC